MKLGQIFGGGRAFETPELIQRRAALKYAKHGDNFEQARLLLIFESSKQRTWLIASNLALYCVIDRLSEPAGRMRWRIPKKEIISDDEIVLPIVVRDNTANTGYVIIDSKRPRLFS